ncbi:DUF742 domain-containing protein [Nocardia sp. NRRL S-836]|uniref:DUF742 domain-containing protein n=1 Tax=Nocardia sp. NRRL S-836 TaxID=1519492 RepID=UPI0006C70EE9|nr:DUF742 domain-containing protein [Nocardia sp. NRRL S-836]KOV79338.1 hypothetical protein ADL03_37325 [Nocardia sp. NRRL S-836]
MSSAAEGHRRRRRAETPAEQTFADLMNGFSLNSSRRRPTPAPQVPAREVPAPVSPAVPLVPQEEEAAFEASAADARDASIVRAYAWTGGRTRSSVNLEIETLVSANDQSRQSAGILQAEHQHVVELCRSPRSVAEVAALMRLPLGVAKVLLGDLAERGLVDVHQTVSAGGDTPDLGLMERVLGGLRRL